MTAQPNAPTTSCGTAHDPEPYIQSGMPWSCQGSVMWGKSRFAPRSGYCADEACYLAIERKP